jgi:hypothetical protein
MERKERDKQERLIPCREWMYQGQPGVPTPASEAHPVAGCEAHMKGEPCLMGRNGKPKYFVHPDEAEWDEAVAAEAARAAEKMGRKAASSAPKPAAAAPAGPAPSDLGMQGPSWRQPAAAAAGQSRAKALASWRNAGNAPKQVFAAPNEKSIIPPATGFYRQRREGKLFPLGGPNNEYEPSWADAVEAEEAAARAAAERGGRRRNSRRKTQKKRKSKSKRSRSRK